MTSRARCSIGDRFIRSSFLEEVRTLSRPSSKGAGSTGAGSRIHRSAGETAPPFRHPARTSFSPSAFRPKSGSDPRRKPKRAPIELPRVLRPECLTKRSAAVRVRSIRSSSRSLPRRELDARGETVQSAGSVRFSWSLRFAIHHTSSPLNFGDPHGPTNQAALKHVEYSHPSGRTLIRNPACARWSLRIATTSKGPVNLSDRDVSFQ